MRIHRAGTKQFIHPEVGPVDVVYHTVTLAADQESGLALTIYTPEPGTDSADRLKLLSSWAVTGQASRANSYQSS